MDARARVPGSPNAPRLAAVVAVAAVVFAVVFALRLTISAPDQNVLLLFTVPIALLGVELGLSGGLAGAAVAIALLAL